MSNRSIDYYLLGKEGLTKIGKRSLKNIHSIISSLYDIWKADERRIMLIFYPIEDEPLVVSYPRDHWKAREALEVLKTQKNKKSKPIELNKVSIKSYEILREVVDQNPFMRFDGNFLKVRSGYREYEINLSTGMVYLGKRRICIYVENFWKLPIHDVVLTEALALLYDPKRIF